MYQVYLDISLSRGTIGRYVVKKYYVLYHVSYGTYEYVLVTIRFDTGFLDIFGVNCEIDGYFNISNLSSELMVLLFVPFSRLSPRLRREKSVCNKITRPRPPIER